jgi:hypothetical protein
MGNTWPVSSHASILFNLIADAGYSNVATQGGNILYHYQKSGYFISEYLAPDIAVPSKKTINHYILRRKKLAQ